MRILVINPNTTQSMTDKVARTARSVATAGTEIVALQPSMGPESIEGFYDEVFCVPGVIDEIRKAGEFDALVLACFDDTGLDAVRCVTRAPVIGIGEAGYHVASMLANSFAVVTTLSRSIPALKHNLHKYGLMARCSGVRAAEVPVLELERQDSDARTQISAQIAAAIDRDHAEAVVLGCAGMTDLAAALEAEHGVPIIDGVACAVKLAEAMAALGLQTSVRGGYAPPRPKKYSGLLDVFAP